MAIGIVPALIVCPLSKRLSAYDQKSLQQEDWLKSNACYGSFGRKYTDFQIVEQKYKQTREKADMKKA